MELELDISEHLGHYWGATGNSSVNGECKCKKRAYGIGGSTSTSGRSGDRDITLGADMGCADRVLPKRARFTARDSVEDISSGVGRARVGEVDYSVIKSMSRFYMLVRCNKIG